MYNIGWGGQGDSAGSLSANLAAAINAGSFANATGGITVTARTNGTAPTNYSLSAGSGDNNYYPQYFSHPSFSASASGSALTGSGSGGAAPGSGHLSLSTPAITTYTYDALNNLLTVFQSARQRTFTYDSFSRLLTSTNPEVGTITYTYDANSNVSTKQDARAITTTSGYDVLNRSITASYSNGDPTVTTTYDQSNCLSLAQCQNIGHRTSMTDAAGSEIWAYDVPDRIHKEQRTTSSITKTSTYNFDFAGDVTSVVYPTGGRTVNYTFDSAGRPSLAQDSANGITYANGTCANGVGSNGVCYAPPGELASASIGVSSSFTGLSLVNSYNNRLQPVELKASSTGGNAFDITYNFVDPVTSHNAGHVSRITNNLNNNRSQIFAYDALNRITSGGTSVKSSSTCWGYLFTYDIWANLTSQAADSTYPGCSETVLTPVTADAHNHISAFAYDASGNAAGDGTYTYAWDGESQLKSAGGVNYLYDGDGRRVSKSSGKLYWYGSGSEILAETNAAGATTNEYIYFGGQRVALLPAGSTAQFYAEDFLGSSRVVTTNTGVVCYDADFTPFGGERSITNSCAQNNYKFEGKERDTETGNDDFGARYYSNRFGRWLSADWSAIPEPVPYADLANPQTLNLYAMVADDPETFADLDGHCYYDGLCTDGVGNVTQSQQPKPAGQCGFLCGLVNYLRDGLKDGKVPEPNREDELPYNRGVSRPGNQNAGPSTPRPSASAAGAIGVVAIGGAELGPADLLLIAAAAATVLYAQNTKQIKEVMDGLAAQIRVHLDDIANHPNSPDPQRGWKKEIRAALERMQRKGRRLGDKAMEKYKDIMDQASQVLK